MSPAAAPRVLVVDDELELAETLRDNLHASGYRAEIAADGDEALRAVAAHPFDLIILDVMLPGRDGFAVCETLRHGGSAVPILFLTAKRAQDDRIRGLEAGGDDYVEKPFSLRELMLRVDTLLRRAAGREGRLTVEFAGNRIDLHDGGARAWDGAVHRLSRAELGVLRVLLEREGEAVVADRILEEVWRGDVFPSTRTVRRLFEGLAQRFEPEPARRRHFHSLPGQGYRFTRRPEHS